MACGLPDPPPRVVLVGARTRAAAERHLAGLWPDEGVGILVGRAGGGRRQPSSGVAVRYLPLPNRALDRRRRFLLDADDLARALARLGARGWIALAILHSHPDGPSGPSRLDAEGALPDLATVIVSGRERPLWRAYAADRGPPAALRPIPLALSAARGRTRSARFAPPRATKEVLSR